MYRGSKMHILDWAEHPYFLPQLLGLAEVAEPRISSKSRWMPRSYRECDEARLEEFGPRCMPSSDVWPALEAWWLKHPKGANTPNWDVALWCELSGRPGLILVEGKAHKSELDRSGKALEANASLRSRENHEQITSAVAEACEGWKNFASDISFSISSHYQLANRLALLGIPTVLIYLGFIGDRGMKDPFVTSSDWREAFEEYSAPAKCKTLWEGVHQCELAPAWLLVRERPVLRESPDAAA
jgi:hypothetical protein